MASETKKPAPKKETRPATPGRAKEEHRRPMTRGEAKSFANVLTKLKAC